MQQNPMAGWGVASLLMLVAAVMVYSRLTAKNETAQLTELVTLRDSENGDTWQMPRGMMEKELYLRGYPVDPNQGLPNPKTGKFTGFPVDAWKETVNRINAERREDEEKSQRKPGAAAPPAPAATAAPSAPPTRPAGSAP
jgi:hypothetical protein